MSDNATVLTRLIDIADAVLCRGRRLEDTEVNAIQAEVEVARGSPTEHKRVVDHHTVALMTAVRELNHARHFGGKRDADVILWSQVAGVILPRVRADLFEALEQRNMRPTP
jgi:hypothetical protein